jgi:hypothetical protein
MKTKLHSLFMALAWLALSTLNFQLSTAHAQGTAFTYQGRLNDGANPANGTYDLTFSLFNASTGGSQVGSTLTNSAVGVTNGLFTVTADFGAVFDGTSRWLQIGVRADGGSTFNLLSPRQELTPAPYALYAPNAGNAATAGTAASASAVAPDSVSGASILAGSIMASNLNLASVSSGLANSFWGLSGTAGSGGSSFLGTTDNQPLDLRADNSRGLRLQYAFFASTFSLSRWAGVNVIGGYAGNYIPSSVVGGTIAGGGYSFWGGRLFGYTDYTNSVTDTFGTVGGGYNNTAGNSATVPGGYGNTATGTGSFAAGRNAQTANAGSFIWSDGSQPFSSSGVNCFDVLATGGVFLNHGSAGVNLDQSNLGNGSINYGLRFGSNSGEGIASKRTAGGNAAGLDFYTDWTPRMSISNGGSVGIGTTTPTETLEINGTSRIDDHDMYLRTGTDRNHGLGYRATVSAIAVDGPFLYGWNGGALGTMGPQSLALKWDWQGNAWVSNNLSTATLTIRGGADLAEPFPISTTDQKVSAGAVVVIDEENPGHLKLADRAYDTRVAGVVSGANGINPGIQMHQEGLMEDGKNVALTGRVYVQADASNGAIQPGDLLTTSSTPGRAMKVTDHAKAAGAILGKAMTGLSEGKGLVLVLVTLQ